MAIQLPSPVVATAIATGGADPDRLPYPHVDGITDWQTQQSVKMLWDRIHALQAQQQALLATQTSIIATLNSLITAVGQIQILAEQAYAKTQQP